MKKFIFIFIVLFIIILSTLFEIVDIWVITKKINKLQKETCSNITIFYENDKRTFTNNETFFNDFFEKINNILTLEKDSMNQSFLRGDTQDVVEVFIENIDKSYIKITFAYSYTKELCRITVYTKSKEIVYKLVNLSELDFKYFIKLFNEVYENDTLTKFKKNCMEK